MKLRQYLFAVLCFCIPQVHADSLELTLSESDLASFEYEFEERTLGGFERLKVGDGIRVRGWQVGAHTHFGQTKVNDKWGLGFVYQNGNTSYGVNHRGIEFNRRF